MSKSEAVQAEQITKVIQTELVNNLDCRLYSVEQNVKRTVNELKLHDTPDIMNNAGQILKILIDGDSIIKGCSIVMIPAEMTDGKEWMVYLKRKGSELESMQLGETSYSYTSRQWYQAPLTQGKGVWSKPYIDDGAGDYLMLTYALPMQDENGNIFGEVTADIAISDLDEELNALMPYPGSYSFTLTKSGKLLDCYPYSAPDSFDRSRIPDFPAVLKSMQLEKTFALQGSDFICTFTPVDNIDLVICTASPFKSIRTITSRLKLPLLIILFIGFILLSVGLRIALLRAMRPLNILTKAAIKVGNGDFDTVIPPLKQYTDLAQLRGAMVYMIDSIKKYIVEIEETTRVKEHISSQLRIARDIQRSLLPSTELTFDCDNASIQLLLGAAQESALEVGGDLYDYVDNGDRLYFIIADVSGKGIPAALMMSYVKSLFHFAAQQRMEPSDIAGRINVNLCADNKHDMFVTLQVGYIDVKEKRLIVSNGGHNPLIICSGGICRFLQLPVGLPAGVIDDFVYVQSEMQFSSGDSIFMYTDGVSEAENGDKVFYGQDSLLKLIYNLLEVSTRPSEVVTSVMDEIERYSEGHFADDITVLCIMAKDKVKYERKYKLKYDLSEVGTILSSISQVGKEKFLSESIVQKVMLVAEEVVCNIINHSPQPTPEAMIEVVLKVSDRQVELVVSDSGKPFNPLKEAPEVDPTLPVEQRKIGGLGIFLIRQLADSLEYERDSGDNILKSIFKLDKDDCRC